MLRTNGWRVGITVAFLVLSQFPAPSTSTSAQAPAPERETFAELPGVKLWYKDTGGSGVPVVFVHAATGSSRVWE